MAESKQIIGSNLRRMLGQKEGDMKYLFLHESVGGSARTYNGLPCTALNFYFNNDGRMIYFGNFQDVPERIRDKFPEASLKMAVDLRSTNFDAKIVELLYFTEIPSHAKKVLEETISQYNMFYGKNDLVKTIFDK